MWASTFRLTAKLGHVPNQTQLEKLYNRGGQCRNKKPGGMRAGMTTELQHAKEKARIS